jgi:hypothetical protein
MPTVNPSPWGPKPQFELADGTPAVGNRLFAYVAGSVGTKQNTYTDSTGSVANTNPLVLNALGQPTTQWWFQVGVSYKIVFAPPGVDDPPNSPIWTIDNLLGINDTTSAPTEWIAGPVPTFISATSFTLVGDQTQTFQVGRRLRTTNSGGTVYSTILTSAFAAVTTVTVVNDSGVLDAGLSAVSYGLESATNPSVPLLIDTFPIRSGSADKTKKVRFEVDGLTTATTRVITVPDFDTDLQYARATSTTDAGGIELATQAEVDTGTDAIRAITPSTLKGRGRLTAIVAATSLPAANSVVITNIPQTFSALILVLSGLSFDTAVRRPVVQVSTNNGSSYDGTKSSYGGIYIRGATAATLPVGTLLLGNDSVAATDTHSSATVITGYQAGTYTHATSSGFVVGVDDFMTISTYVLNTNAMDALRIINSSTGNFDAGTYALYGVN